MKIYTSYYSMIKNLPKDIVPVAISSRIPVWYKGSVCKLLQPAQSLEDSYQENRDVNLYTNAYISVVLDKLMLCEVLMNLQQCMLARNREAQGVCLVCFEKGDAFCHRHLVAKWLNSFGYICEEYKY